MKPTIEKIDDNTIRVKGRDIDFIFKRKDETIQINTATYKKEQIMNLVTSDAIALKEGLNNLL